VGDLAESLKGCIDAAGVSEAEMLARSAG
jgi:hypothetical protein